MKSLSCVQLCNPIDCSLPGSSVHGIFQARVLEWGAMVKVKALESKCWVFHSYCLENLDKIENQYNFDVCSRKPEAAAL